MQCYIHAGESFPRESMQEHHICPRAYGGTDDPDNRIWICSGDHDVLHRAALKLYANKAGEARDIVQRYLLDQPARQERMWKLVKAVAEARAQHARSTDIPEAGLDGDHAATVKMSLDVPDWLHHRLKALATGQGLYRYVMGVLENHALVATQKPGASKAELYGPPRQKPTEPDPNPAAAFWLIDPTR